MDTLERRIFLCGLRIDFNIVDMFPNMVYPMVVGHYLLPMYRMGGLDKAVASGGI